MNWFLSVLTFLGVYEPPVQIVLYAEPTVLIPIFTKPLEPDPENEFKKCIDAPEFDFGGATLVIAIASSKEIAKRKAADFRLEMNVRDPKRDSHGLFPDYDRLVWYKRPSLW